MNSIWLKISSFALLIFFSWTPLAGPPKKPQTSHRQVAQLTQKEKEFVKKAQATFKAAAKEPPPTVHMMDKMQSGVPQ